MSALSGAFRDAAPRKPAPRGVFMRMREWFDPLIFAFLLAMFIRTFIVELFKIPSGSMTPTLVGDVVADVDFDGDGDDDLIVARGATALGGRAVGYQVFLRDEKGLRLRLPEPIVASLPLSVAAQFEERKHARFDRICVNKFAYWFSPPERGDITVFKVPRAIWSREKPIYVKRLVGLPNETVAIRDNRLWVDGAQVVEPAFFGEQFYTNDCESENRRVHFSQRRLGPNEYLLFGDNTLSSSDGRVWGPVAGENLKGKAFFRYLPLRHMRFL